MVYGETYKLSLYNNPTIAIDQVNGDEFVQVADRSALGTPARSATRSTLPASRSTRLGSDIRTDFIDQRTC